MDRLKIKGCPNFETFKGFGSNYVGGRSNGINVRIKKLKITYTSNLISSWLSCLFIVERLKFITIYLSTYKSIPSYAIILSLCIHTGGIA